MLGWFQALMPKEERFFALFNAHAATLIAGADALRRMLDGGAEVENQCRRIMEHEHEADTVAREVLFAVRRTFITPFDRADIRELTSSLDDAIDQMQRTAKVVLLFEVDTFDAPMVELGDIIVEAAALTQQAVSLLPALARNKDRLNALTEQISRLETRSDTVYDAGMKALFKASRSDPMRFRIGSEIYGDLERVVDRFEDVADRINGILIEHV
jgi:predicted phosphate transport protein (TIGR00153 family)